MPLRIENMQDWSITDMFYDHETRYDEEEDTIITEYFFYDMIADLKNVGEIDFSSSDSLVEQLLFANNKSESIEIYDTGKTTAYIDCGIDNLMYDDKVYGGMSLSLYREDEDGYIDGRSIIDIECEWLSVEVPTDDEKRVILCWMYETLVDRFHSVFDNMALQDIEPVVQRD